MMKKIKTWFRNLFLRWCNGVPRDEYERVSNCLADKLTEHRAFKVDADETIAQLENAVDWLRDDNNHLLRENANLKAQFDNIKTITAEIDLNTSDAWKNADTVDVVKKLKSVFVKQFGESCLPYMQVFRDDNNYLSACVNIVEYDR
ncbi:MAG: hypothetical protein KBT06_08595 [Prevotellaceae bacterium]|nr:hypothetical protein [Candidatus Colivivens equi]